MLLITIALTCQSCLVSRCKRPQITGYIYDSISRKPEAPPLTVNEAIIKDGYENKSIQLFNPFGGGIRKGAVHNCDTIFLKRTPIIAVEK